MNNGSVSTDLYQFFAAYFHEDWVLEADDWQGVVDEYVKDDPVAEPLKILAQEIETLRMANSEPDLEQLLDKIGVNYYPQTLSYNEWLERVAERLRQHANAIENGTTFLSGQDLSTDGDGSMSHDLDQFFAEYFDRDQPPKADDWPGTVDRYATSSTRPSRQLLALAAEIDEFRESRSSSELHATFIDIGHSFDPRPKLTYKEWLWLVAKRLRQHATAIENGGAIT